MVKERFLEVTEQLDLSNKELQLVRYPLFQGVGLIFASK